MHGADADQGVAGPPACMAAVAATVERRLDELLRGEEDRWGSVDADLAEPLAALRRFVLGGGKRLRPAFCHWAYVGAGGDPGAEAPVRAGAALELLHTFALIHDDVMDGSRQRRGAATIHAAFEADHAARRWRGEARRFGEGVAILVGDLAFVYADMLMAGAPVEALDVFAVLRLEVNMGQYLDLANTVRGGSGREAARRISHYKSGLYTVERPLHLGAALAGRLDRLAGELSAVGTPLGEAFQLRDDLLGVFGDPARTGKPVGEDLRDGKPTLLRAIAAERAAGADADLLARLGDPGLSAAEVEAVQRVLERTGARADVERRVDDLLAASLRALEGSALVPEAKAALADIARFIGGRAH